MSEKLITALSPIGTVIAGAFALYFWIDTRYAHQKPDFEGLQRRFDIKVKSDALQQTNTRIWQLGDHIADLQGKGRTDQTAKDDLRRLQEEKKNLDFELTELQKNKP
jgi:hypothetical protein